MPRIVTDPDAHYSLPGEVYRLQRRPGMAQIILNDHYQGISILDGWSGAQVARLPFPSGYPADGLVSAWCLRADGDALLLLHQESHSAGWLSLSGDEPSCAVALPPLPNFNDLRYNWEDDSLWLSAGKSNQLYRLAWQGGQARFEERSGIEARLAQPAWRRALEALSTREVNVLRVEMDNARLLYHKYSPPAEVGMINWREGRSWTAPAAGQIPGLAFYREHMFILEEAQVQAVDANGEIKELYPAPARCSFSAMDVLLPSPGSPAALVLACSPLDRTSLTQFRAYRLEG